MAEFHELRGEYVENAGQVMNLREYLDYFEPLGSALSRLPNGTGGPFVHSFTDSGGHKIGSLGWVISAAAKRFGGWKLWGMWTNRAMPAVALPLFWSALSDPDRVAALVDRANDDSARLLSRDRWPELLDDVHTNRLHDSTFRELLKAELARAYAIAPPHRHPIEIELESRTLDLLPWLYLLGPVDPASAQLQPNRFNGAGYQYILSDHAPRRADVEVRREIASMVDKAASDVFAGWEMANELRARRGGPKVEARPPRARREKQSPEVKDMVTKPVPAKQLPLWRAMLNEAAAFARLVGTGIYRLIVLALLTWIALNIHFIRKATVTASKPPATESSSSPAPTFEGEITPERVRRIGTALAKPPRNIRVDDAVLSDIARGDDAATGALARVAVEIFLRTNGCFERTETVDGKFSTAEGRAIRNCATLQDERLIRSGTEPDDARAIEWLESRL